MDYDFSKIKELIKTNKLLITVLKVIVFVATAYFLLTIFHQNYQQIKTFIDKNNLMVLGFIFASAVVYMGLLAILAKGWQAILESIIAKQIDSRISLIYLNSLVYKYLPGNIFHYASRQIAANKIGIQHITLLKSNIYEAICLIVSAGIFAIFLIPTLFPHSGFYLIGIGVLSLVLISYYFRQTKWWKIILKSLPYYLVYFLAIGLICDYMINNIIAIEVPLIQCIALYSIAWIAGFVIPGAPGGIGVRETVFIVLSNNIISQSDAVIVISILRLSTTLGEVFAHIFAKINYPHQNDTLG